MALGAWGLAVGLTVFSAWAVRSYGAESAYQAALTGISGERSADYLYRQVESALRWAPEHGRARTLRGQSFFTLAQKANGVEKKVLLEMAQGDLAPAFRANPSDGSLLLTLAQTRAGLGESGSALALLEEALRRRPGYAEHAWLLARNLPAGSAAQKEAYRLVTRLRPQATPEVLRELAPGDVQSDYIAETPAAYRAWAWSVTEATEGVEIAKRGLAFAELPRDRYEAGWLEYYIGLKVMESEPSGSLAWFRKAIEHVPGEHAFHRNFGFALLKSGRSEEAKTQFQKSIQLNGDIANAAYLGLAQAEEGLGSRRRAMSLYRRLESNPRLEAWVRREAGAALRQLEKNP